MSPRPRQAKRKATERAPGRSPDDSASLASAHERLLYLYQISKLLTRFDDVDVTVPEIFAIMRAAIPVRMAILVLAGPTALQSVRKLTWRRDDVAQPEIQSAIEDAVATYAYLSRSLVNHEGQQSPPSLDSNSESARAVSRQKSVVLPLVVAHGNIFGVLQLQGASALDENELIFLNAVVNQLAIAIDRRVVVDARQAESRASELFANSAKLAAERNEVDAVALRGRYEALIDNLDHAIVWELDAETLDIIYVSARIEILLGVRRDRGHAAQASWLDLVHLDDRDKVRETMVLAVAEGRDKRCEHRMTTGDGGERWFHTGVHAAVTNRGRRLQGVSVDITPAKHAERLVRDQLDFTRSLATSLGEGVLAVDLDCRVTFANRAAEELLGKKSKDILGQPVSTIATLATADGVVATPLERVMRTGRIHRSDDYVLSPIGGDAVPVSASVTCIRRSGEVAGAIIAFQDITGRKQTEAALIDAVRAREQVLSIVSHELRNPIGAILMSTEYLVRSAPSDDRRLEARRRVDAIGRSASRMARLVEDLSDFASLQAGRLSITQHPESPLRLMQESIASFEALAAEKRISVSVACDAELPNVRCDRDRFVQIIGNLVANALKVTAPGGAIVLAAKAQGADVLFTVSDSGRGIAPEQLGNIFERYWRGANPTYKGTGLGLTIAKGIVDAHGGQIWVESQLGVGTTFFFTIPVADESDIADDRRDSTVSQTWALPENARPILVVDDDQDLREVVVQVLEREGFRVVAAANGSEALARLQGDGLRPCLILLDLTMPVMDGWTFVAERNKDAELAAIPLALLSGAHDLSTAAAALHASTTMRKPIRVDDLVKLARSCCSKSESPT